MTQTTPAEPDKELDKLLDDLIRETNRITADPTARNVDYVKARNSTKSATLTLIETHSAEKIREGKIPPKFIKKIDIGGRIAEFEWLLAHPEKITKDYIEFRLTSLKEADLNNSGGGL